MLTTNSSMMLARRMTALRQIMRTNTTGLLLLLLVAPRCADVMLSAKRSLRLRVLVLDPCGNTHSVTIKRKTVASTILRCGHGYKIEDSQIARLGGNQRFVVAKK